MMVKASLMYRVLGEGGLTDTCLRSRLRYIHVPGHDTQTVFIWKVDTSANCVYQTLILPSPKTLGTSEAM